MASVAPVSPIAHPLFDLYSRVAPVIVNCALESEGVGGVAVASIGGRF
jgi:hypothetical protein